MSWNCNGRTIQQRAFGNLANCASQVLNCEDGKCLDGSLATFGHNGSKVQLWRCFNPVTPIQQWFFVPT